jgi:hypothetical protein
MCIDMHPQTLHRPMGAHLWGRVRYDCALTSGGTVRGELTFDCW